MESTASDHRGGVDLISNLVDDVLVHVLGLLPATSDVVRACVVSRRWRHLWPRVSSLRFESFETNQERADRFVAFVNHALAARAAHPDAARVDQLAISLFLHSGGQHLAAPTISDAQVDAWIRRGMQQQLAAKSFIFKFHRLPRMENNLRRFIDGGMVLDELPSSTGLEAMTLSLSNATLRLPATVAFDSLTHLTLEGMRLAAGSSHHLGRLLSSPCCPRLRKLWLTRLAGLTELQLDAGELLELWLHGRELEGLYHHEPGIHRLQLNTPKLRLLQVGDCSCTLQALAMSAPRMEELDFSSMQLKDIDWFAAGDLSRVRRLKGLRLRPRGRPFHGAGVNDCVIRLLQRCTSLECLGLFFGFPEYSNWGETEEVDMMKDVPSLPRVISLSATALPSEMQGIVNGIACLFVRCSSLRYLQLQMMSEAMTKDDDHAISKDHLSIKSPSLREIDISGYEGRKCEASLMEWLHATGPALQRIKLNFGWGFRRRSTEELINLLPQIPFAEAGSWSVDCTDRCSGDYRTFVWTPTCEEE